MTVEAAPVEETAISTEAFQDIEVLPTKCTQILSTGVLLLGWWCHWFIMLWDRWLLSTWGLSLYLQARLLATSILPIFLSPGPLQGPLQFAKE